MQKLIEQATTEALSVLIWGGAKTGKTFFAGTMQDHVLYISNGMGSATLKSEAFKQHVQPGPDFYLEEVSYDSPKAAVRAVQKIARLVEEGIASADVHTIIIDDATAATRSFTLQAIEFNGITGKTKSNERKLNTGLAIPDVSDYGTEMDMGFQFYSEVLSDCKASGKQFILLAHERYIYKAGKLGELPILLKSVPAFTGADKNPDRIPGLFDWVLHTRKKVGANGPIYMVDVEGREDCMAGCRKAAGYLPREIRDADLKKMLSCVDNKEVYK